MIHLDVLNERALAASFKALVSRIPARELAKAADRTIDSAKCWKKGRCCPNASSLINMARTMPEVRAWALAYMGVAPAPEARR